MEYKIDEKTQKMLKTLSSARKSAEQQVSVIFQVLFNTLGIEEGTEVEIDNEYSKITVKPPKPVPGKGPEEGGHA
jgi:hypothetical protein